MKNIANKYEVLKNLGQGSYGKVYLVKHTYLGLRYALKLLNRSLSDDETFIDRFKMEAEILVRFSHPGTVQLRDFGRTDEGFYYMATDFSPGEILEQVLSREKWFPAIRALNFMIQILEVLEAAHDMTIVHRDIKPANIMVETSGDGKEVIKVLDFGIAKLTKDVWQGERVTGEGYVIGTPEYMSTEQAAGEATVDARTDIYSCGILLYEMITGDVPFRGQTVLQTLLKHMTQPPPPFAKRLGMPEYIEEVVFQAIKKEPGDRFQNAAQFKGACLDALASIRREGSGTQNKTIVIDEEEPEDTKVEEPKNEEPMKLLCLDDTEMILHIAQHIFEKEGYEVFTAQSFATIYPYIFEKGTKIMLCDVQMPGLPGTKICEMLKNSVPGMKIILFSNLPDRELEKLADQCKADAWLSKNSKPDEWIAKVKNIKE